MRRITEITWTWRVTTISGQIIIPNVPVSVAIRKAGLAGPESVQPATAEEHAKAVEQERGLCVTQ
jgi:hypothetical protein